MTYEPDSSEPGNFFHIGGERAECLDVRVLARSEAEDYWDGNWLSCKVAVVAGGFEGRFIANLRVDELARFSDEVSRLYEVLSGEATLTTLEGQVSLSLRGDGRGHIECSGNLQDVAGTGNTLTFSLSLDQTQLVGTMAQLAELLQRFPLRGSPAA